MAAGLSNVFFWPRETLREKTSGKEEEKDELNQDAIIVNLLEWLFASST
jgi:hypothetical protein